MEVHNDIKSDEYNKLYWKDKKTSEDQKKLNQLRKEIYNLENEFKKKYPKSHLGESIPLRETPALQYHREYEKQQAKARAWRPSDVGRYTSKIKVSGLPGTEQLKITESEKIKNKNELNKLAEQTIKKDREKLLKQGEKEIQESEKTHKEIFKDDSPFTPQDRYHLESKKIKNKGNIGIYYNTKNKKLETEIDENEWKEIDVPAKDFIMEATLSNGIKVKQKIKADDNVQLAKNMIRFKRRAKYFETEPNVEFTPEAKEAWERKEKEWQLEKKEYPEAKVPVYTPEMKENMKWLLGEK